MTKDEVIKIIFVIRANYPETYARMGKDDAELLATSWMALLQDYSYEEISLALQNYLVNDTYGKAPKVGQLIESLHKVAAKDELNANEAWALVYKAICNSTYNAEAEYNKLPPVVQKAVGHYRNLQDYASMSIEDVQVTIKAHFKSIYEVEAKRAKELAKLPKSIKERLGSNESLRIGEQ